MTASRALQIAFEDVETIYFIRTNFSSVEQRPQIITRKWRPKSQVSKWNIAIIEKIPCFFNQRRKFLNIALLEVDSQRGKVTRRKFYKNIFSAELKRVL